MVKIYAKTACPKCKLLKEKLKDNNIEFEEVNIDENQEALDKLIDRGFSSAPVLQYNDSMYDYIAASKIMSDFIKKGGISFEE